MDDIRLYEAAVLRLERQHSGAQDLRRFVPL
jgi:hypothetical protein